MKEIVRRVVIELLNKKKDAAVDILDSEYKFISPVERKRNYTDVLKCKLFLKMGT